MYGIDLGDERTLTGRSWPWLKTRIVGLLGCDCRTTRVLFPPKPPAAAA